MTDSLPASLSEDQRATLDAFAAFVASPDDSVFIMSGAAGTGKTTLIGQMVEAARSLNRQTHLAALTGRAATIAKVRTGRDATTLHSFLYRFDPRASKVVEGLPQLVFSLRDPRDDTVSVLFVDEASMLGSGPSGELATMQFGSGNLAADLVGYWFTRSSSIGRPSKLVLVGDPFQLPPVGNDESIAFSSGWQALVDDVVGSRLSTVRADLNTVHRQGLGGVLDLATRYRDAMEVGDFRTIPMPPIDDAEVRAHATEGASLLPWARQVAADPHSHAIIAYTNAGVAVWNRRVRQERWGDADAPIRAGDVVVTTRHDPRSGLDNGELLQVETADAEISVIAHLGREVHLRQVAVQSASGGQVFDALLADGTLDSPDRTMSRDDSQVLWVDFTQRHRGLRDSTPEFWDAVRRDPILNPIVAKYGYALTGHKAQSGQWERVVVDFAAFPMAPDSEHGFRWAYTAITRARSGLDLIDQPHRSPFSRLTSGAPGSTSDAIQDADSGLSALARRERAEGAVVAWAASHAFRLTLIGRKDYNTRYELAREGRVALFDVYFGKDGIATNRLPVRSDPEPMDDLMPPISLLERASMEGMARPRDPRVDDALKTIENALRADQLSVHFRRAPDWAVELEVGIESAEEVGVLVLHFRKSGVFSSPTWKRAPSEEVRMRVGLVLERLARA